MSSEDDAAERQRTVDRKRDRPAYVLDLTAGVGREHDEQRYQGYEGYARDGRGELVPACRLNVKPESWLGRGSCRCRTRRD